MGIGYKRRGAAVRSFRRGPQRLGRNSAEPGPGEGGGEVSGGVGRERRILVGTGERNWLKLQIDNN